MEIRLDSTQTAFSHDAVHRGRGRVVRSLRLSVRGCHISVILEVLGRSVRSSRDAGRPRQGRVRPAEAGNYKPGPSYPPYCSSLSHAVVLAEVDMLDSILSVHIINFMITYL